jgi:methyl-accepting chemotaxis protein
MRIYLLLVFILLGVVPLSFFTYVLLNTYEDKTINSRIDELKSQGMTLSNILYKTVYLTNGSDPVIDANINRVADIYNGRIIIVNNSLMIVKDTYSIAKDKYLVSDEVIQCLNGNTVTPVNDREAHNLKLAYPITHNETKEIMGVIVMSFSTKDIQSIRNSMEQRVVLFALTLAVLIVVFAIYFSGILTKPLTGLMHSINHITEGYMDEGISIKGYNEIEKISDAFNHMLSQMQKLESSRQEFVSNVSHELKTPITSIKVLADSF